MTSLISTNFQMDELNGDHWFQILNSLAVPLTRLTSLLFNSFSFFWTEGAGRRRHPFTPLLLLLLRRRLRRRYPAAEPPPPRPAELPASWRGLRRRRSCCFLNFCGWDGGLALRGMWLFLSGLWRWGSDFCV